MSNLVGMNVEAVENAGRQLKSRAHDIRALSASINSLVEQMQATWCGQDAVRFKGWWEQQHRPALERLRESIDGLGQSALNNASEQSHASAALGTGLAAGAGEAAVGVSAGGRHESHSDATMLEFAKIANGGVDVPPGWKALGDDDLRRLGINPVALRGNENDSSLDGRVFTDGDGHYVLAFGGSQGDMFRPGQADSKDWRENYQSLSTGLPLNWSHQAQDAADVAYQLKSTVGADNMEIVGYSLGGRDASVAAAATGVHAVTFNAAAPTDEDLLYARMLAGDQPNIVEYGLSKVSGGQSLRMGIDESRITNYVSSDDPLTAVEKFGQEQVGGRTALGHQVVVPGSGHGHGLESFDGKLPGHPGGDGGW